MASQAIMAIFFLVVALAISTYTQAKHKIDPTTQKLKKTNVVFYMHDWESGLNVTNKIVAGVLEEQWWILGFETVFAYDDKLTEACDRNSTEIRRAHGVYINTALDGSDLHLLLSIVFTNKEFGGSTLEIQRSDRLFLKYRDVSIMGGTGKFTLARRIVTIETIFVDLVNFNAIIRFNLTIYHY